MKFVLLCRKFSLCSRYRDAVTVEAALTAKALSRAGHEVVVLTGEAFYEYGRDREDSNISILGIPDQEIVHPFRYRTLLEAIEPLRGDCMINYLSFMLLPKFNKLLKRLNMHACHRIIHGKLFLSEAKHGLTDLLIKYPMAYGKFDFYDLARLVYPGFILGLLPKTLGTLITLSRRAQEWFLESGLDDIVTIHPPVEPAWFSALNEAQTESKSSKLLYYGGGPAVLRGIDTLLDAMNLLGNMNVSLEICLRSSEERDEDLLEKAILKHGLSSRVTVLSGFQNLEFLVRAVQQSACVVLPFKLMAKVSDIPLTLLEPMACGTPVIASRIGAVSEVIENGKNGLLVDPGDPKQLSEAIRRILQDDSLRNHLSSNARKSMQAFRSEVVMKQLVRVVEACGGESSVE